MGAGQVRAAIGSRCIPVLFRARGWLATLLASVATTYALDFVATSAGLLLVALHWHDGLDYGAALLILLGSYVAWGGGLWAILQVNWDLLQRTGTSTNLLSKAAHDLAARLALSLRWRRVAAHGGYIATELAKEAPYYLGAAGAVLFTSSISAVDAIVFLAGANIGAAAYEFALARGMRYFLGWLIEHEYASFEAEWRPLAYLAEYYRSVKPDEQRTIAYFVEAMRTVPPGRKILVYGAGPTLHHVFLAAEKASEVHLAEHLPENRREIERWLARDPDAHDWQPFVRYTLACEGKNAPDEQEVDHREELTRAKITRLLPGDLRLPCPLERGDDQYDVVISAYCADSSTADRAEWRVFMQRILALVGPGGLFITAALRRSNGYLVGGKRFPSPGIDETDLRAVLEAHCEHETLNVEVASLGSTGAKGYSSITLAHGRRGGAAAA